MNYISIIILILIVYLLFNKPNIKETMSMSLEQCKNNLDALKNYIAEDENDLVAECENDLAACENDLVACKNYIAEGESALVVACENDLVKSKRDLYKCRNGLDDFYQYQTTYSR